MKVCARVVPGSTMDIVLFTPSEYNPDLMEPLQLNDEYEPIATGVHRQKREAYDPYDAYYFYPKSLNQRPSYYDRPAPEESFINRRDAEESNRVAEKGQKYKYTPLFQYKSTQSRRRKLFVPNLFG